MKIQIYRIEPIEIDVRTFGDPNAEPLISRMEVSFILNGTFDCDCIMLYIDDKELIKEAIIEKILKDEN